MNISVAGFYCFIETSIGGFVSRETNLFNKLPTPFVVFTKGKPHTVKSHKTFPTFINNSVFFLAKIRARKVKTFFFGHH